MKCFTCGNPEMKSERRDHVYVESGLPNVVLHDLEFLTCSKCGEEYRSIPKLGPLHELIARAVADKPGRLTGAEVRFLRKHLGWSGQDFARIMGVAPETVSRWENEKEAMGVVADRLLRLMAVRLVPLEEYPNERLAEVGKDAGAPMQIDLRANRTGWKSAA